MHQCLNIELSSKSINTTTITTAAAAAATTMVMLYRHGHGHHHHITRSPYISTTTMVAMEMTKITIMTFTIRPSSPSPSPSPPPPLPPSSSSITTTSLLSPVEFLRDRVRERLQFSASCLRNHKHRRKHVRDRATTSVSEISTKTSRARLSDVRPSETSRQYFGEKHTRHSHADPRC